MKSEAVIIINIVLNYESIIRKGVQRVGKVNDALISYKSTQQNLVWPTITSQYNHYWKIATI